MRTVYNINSNWLFVKEYKEEYLNKEVDYEKFGVIELPHTFNDVDGDIGMEFFRGQVVYRRNIELNEAMLEGRLFVEFEGVALESDVYYNGKHLGHHAGGFSTFRYEIGELSTIGDNLLVVVADNRYSSPSTLCCYNCMNWKKLSMLNWRDMLVMLNPVPM